ncbi:proliferating cell nuclear antigen protein, partial [Helicosporidium sp. ATCC 50920]
FQRICRDLSTIGDTVEISITKDGIRFQTAGDIGRGVVTCQQSASSDAAAPATEIDMREQVCLTFALRYLNSFTKATALSPAVCIRLNSDLPVVVEYRLAEMGHVRYYLAPKIEDDGLEG